MSNKLWGRKYKINVINEKTGKAWDVSNLRCTFRIEKVALALVNISVIDVYNLNPATESDIIKEGNRVTVEAGYDGFEETKDAKGAPTKTPSQYGKIYDGDIVQVIRTRENNIDYKLTIVCMDGEFFLNQGWVMLSMAPNSTPRKVVETIAEKSKFKVPVGKISDNLDKSKLPRGKVLFGQPRDYLRDISYNNNGTFYVEDGQLYLNTAKDVPSGSVIEISAKTGLIGYPTQTQDGVTFKCLLNPKIKSNVVCKLNNEDIIPVQVTARGQLFTPLDFAGEYLVTKHTHSGDTRGQEWYTTVVAVGVAGGGKLQMLMENKISPNGGGG